MAAPDSPKRRIVAKKPARVPAVAETARPSSDSRESIWPRVGRVALYAVAAVLPWLVLPATGTAADAAKTVFAALAATVGIVALLADTIERRRLTYPGSLAGLGVLGVVAATALSTIFSRSASLSLFGGLVLTDSLLHLCIAAILFVLAAAFIADRFEAEKLLASFLWGTSIALFVSILGMLGVPYFELVAVSGSLSALGFLAVLAMGLSTIAPWEELRLHGRILVAKVAVLGIVTLALVNYAELWIALALVALLTAGAAFMRRTSIRLPLAFAVVALALTLVGPYLPSVGVPRGEVRPNVASSLVPVRGALSSSDALLGTGPATYSYAFAETHGKEWNGSPFWNARFDQATSFLLTVPVTGGLVGLLAWLFLGASALLLAWRRLASPVGAGAGLAVALAALALLLFPASFAQLAAAAIALGVLVGTGGSRRTLPFSGPATWRLLGTFAALVLVAAGSLAGLYVVGQKFAASLYGGAAARAAGAGDIDATVARLARAVSLDSSDLNLRALSQAYLGKFQQLSAEGGEEGGQQLEAALTLAVQAAQAAIAENPADARNHGNLGAIYEGMAAFSEGAGAQALDAYAAAAKLEPGNPAWKLAEARAHGELAAFQRGAGQPADGSYASAQAALDSALALKEDYVDALFVSARLRLEEGNADAADQRMQRIVDLAPADAELMLQAGLLYYRYDRLDRAQAFFARAISLAPEFANARYFSGLTLSRQGQNDAALAQFRWILERNPDSAEIQKIVANLEGGRPVLEGIADEPAAPAASSTEPAVPVSAADLPQQP